MSRGFCCVGVMFLNVEHTKRNQIQEKLVDPVRRWGAQLKHRQVSGVDWLVYRCIVVFDC